MSKVIYLFLRSGEEAGFISVYERTPERDILLWTGVLSDMPADFDITGEISEEALRK